MVTYIWGVCGPMGLLKQTQKCTCLKKIELHNQIMITIVDSTINIVRGKGKDNQDNLYDHLMSTRIFTLRINKKCMWAHYDKSGYNLDLNTITIWY